MLLDTNAIAVDDQVNRSIVTDTVQSHTKRLPELYPSIDRCT
jgi:hypothetical protein